MVIVYPNGVVFADRVQKRCAERFIDLAILLPAGFVVPSVGGKVVEERPDRLVAKALIEIFEILLRKKDRTAVVFRQRFGFYLFADFVRDGSSRPAHPKIL